MPDDLTAGEPTPAPRCTWCSAVLPPDHGPTCPSCGATLIGEGDAAVPGLTALDADAILRNARTGGKPKSRGRLLSWISGDYPGGEEGAKSAPGSLSPPPVEVRREMLRLELEAQVANAQAEVEAMAADAAIESGTPLKSVEEMVEEADVADGLDPATAAELAPMAAVPAADALTDDPDSAAATASADAEPPAVPAPEPEAGAAETPPA
ncbi:MAG TPA: hypothetical protein VID95_08320 [Candidatus Limnocylindrales bacterium]